MALSVPAWGWWPLAFLGAAILYRHLAGLSFWRRLLSGWLAGLGLFVPGLIWTHAFNWYGAVVLMVIEALAPAVAAAVVPPGRGRLPLYVGAFTLLEALRMTWPFGGLPLGGVSLGQAGGPMLGAARLGGPLLLTALVFLGGGALAELAGWAAARWTRPWPAVVRVIGPQKNVASGATAALLVVGLGAVAVLAPDGGSPVGSVVAAAVQGGGRRGVSQSEVAPPIVYTAQLRATARLVQDPPPGPRPTLVVWPEDVVALDQPLAQSSAAPELSSVARQLRATFLAGITVTISKTAFLNRVVAWSPSGRVVGVFEKVHRVPFGEYVPFRGFFSHLADLSGVPRDAVPGTGSGLMRTPAGPLGLMVSFEVFFPDRARASVRAGAHLLVVPTNTSSYSTSQVPSQEVAADRLRAVEEGRDLVQAAPTGYSVLVDHDGGVVSRGPLGSPALVVGRLALRDRLTLYGRFGDLPVLVLAGVAVVGGTALAWRGRSRRVRTS